MLFLLDTNAFSDLVRSHFKIQERLRNLAPPDRVITCPIVRGEVLFGLERLPQGKKRKRLEQSITELFIVVVCEPLPASVGDHYAQIKRSCQRRGLPLDENDLWIAATAVALGAVLVTRDAHFARIEGASVEDWTS